MKNGLESKIFYLRLSQNISEDYILMAKYFQKLDKIIVPISLKTLLEFVSKNETINLVVVVKDVKELRYFNAKVRKALEFMLRAGYLKVYIGSSFDSVMQIKGRRANNFNFVKLPVNTSLFCEAVSKTVDIARFNYNKWPGGRTPRMMMTS